MARQIGGSVGNKGKNVAGDVVAVQELINMARGGPGTPLNPIAVDGVVGPETVAAITRFQSRNFGWSDGRVDPNGRTLARLNTLADAKGNVPSIGLPPASKPGAAKPGAAKPGGGSQFAPPQSGGFAAGAAPGPTVEGSGKLPNWALITSVTGKVKMRFPSSGFVQAFAGFFLFSGSVLMTYDATGAPLTLPMTPEEFNSPYPWQAGSATLLMADGSKKSIGPYSLFVVS